MQWVGANTSGKTSCSEDHGKGYGKTPAATVQRVNLVWAVEHGLGRRGDKANVLQGGQPF